MGTTPKYSLPWPAGTDMIAQGDDAIRSLAETVDPLLSPSSQGTFAARPAAGKVSHTYRATDLDVLFRDDGTTWRPVGRLLRGTLAARPSAVSVGAGIAYVVSDQSNRIDVSDGAAWVEGIGSAASPFTPAASLIDVVNTTAETTIFSQSIGAGVLGTNKAVRLHLIGDYLNSSGAARTVTVRVKLGATTLHASTSGSLAAFANRGGIVLDLLLANQGATNVQRLGGLIHLGRQEPVPITGIGNLGIDTTTLNQYLTPIGGSAAEDTTAAKTLEVTAQFSFAHASLSLRRQYATLELI